MTTTDFSATLSTLPQALAHLQGERRITFEAFDAIMHFHILEVPDFSGFRHNYKYRQWHLLSSQFRAFAGVRHETLLNGVLSRTDPAELYRQGLVIQLLRAMSSAAGSMGQGAPEMDN